MNDQYGNAIELPGPWHSLREIREANAKLGHHWFDADSRAFFGSATPGDKLYAGRLFVSSEQDQPSPHGPGAWDGERRYTVRCARDDGSISTVGEFGQHGSLRAALDHVSELVGAEVTA